MSKILISLSVSALALSGCASTGGNEETSGEPNENFHVAFANYAESIPIYHTIHETLDKLNTEGSGVDISWYNNDADPATMLNNVRLMIQSEPDAIVLMPVSASTEGVSQLLEDSGIPCVSVNLATPACSFLNISNMDLGIETAEEVAKVAEERGWTAENTTVLLGQSAASGEAVNDCVRYFYSTLSNELGLHPAKPEDITPTTTRIGDNGIQFDGQESLEVSYNAVSRLASTIPEGNNIILYTTNNDATSGALRALDERGLVDDDRLLIGGLGGDTTGLENLANDPKWVAEGDIFIDYWGEYAVAMAEVISEGATPPAEVTPLPQIVYGKGEIDLMKEYHPDVTSKAVKLPELVEDNQFLAESDFMKFVGNVSGVGS